MDVGINALLSQCLSPSRSTNGYQHIVGRIWQNAGEEPAMDWHPIQEGVAILLVASCYRNWSSLSAESYEPVGPKKLRFSIKWRGGWGVGMKKNRKKIMLTTLSYLSVIISSIKTQCMSVCSPTRKCSQHTIVDILYKCLPWLILTKEIYDAPWCEKWWWHKEFLHWCLWNIYKGTFKFLHS